MNKKALLFVIVIIVVAVGFYVYDKQQAKAPVPQSQTQINQQPAQISSAPVASTTPVAQTQGSQNAGAAASATFSSGNEGENGGSNIQVIEVDYNGSSFSPSSVSLNVNDYIFFKNKGTAGFWPMAQDQSNYSQFNANKVIAPGSEFKFQFTKVGKWVFVDKLNQSATGIVNVGK